MIPQSGRPERVPRRDRQCPIISNLPIVSDSKWGCLQCVDDGPLRPASTSCSRGGQRESTLAARGRSPGESAIRVNRRLTPRIVNSLKKQGLRATGVTPLAAVKHDFPSRTVLLHPFAGWLADESMTIRLNGPDAAEWVDIDAIEAGAWRDRVPRPSVPILEELVRWIRD